MSETAPAIASRPLSRGRRRGTADTTAQPGLLDRAATGDQVAFAELYRAVQPRLLRYAASLVGQDAEDVTAEAWLQIARDLHTFSGDEQAFRGWAAVIVRHRALDQLRVAARRPVTPVLDDALDRPADFDTAGSAAETMATHRALALISTLPPDQAEAVLLRAVVGLDAASAAKVLGKRPGAVRVAAHRGLKTLAGRLAAPGGDRDPSAPARSTHRSTAGASR